MGKFATYLKRGTSRQFGVMAAPEVGDWTFTSPSTGNYSINRVGSIPGPATKWGGRLRTASTAWSSTAIQSTTPISGSATSGLTYFAQVAWFDAANNQLSPWGDTKTVVIT